MITLKRTGISTPQKIKMPFTLKTFTLEEQIAEDEGALTASAAELNRLRLLVLLCLEAWSTALARLHALCKKELLLLLRKEG